MNDTEIPQPHSPNSPRYQTLQEWLGWMETLHPTDIDLGLDRISIVGKRLGLKKLMSSRAQDTEGFSPKIVSIAGTNGKGSCVAALETLLRVSGKTVGAYSSPHLRQYNERVRINGQDISDEALCRAFFEIDEARKNISLTYFEFGTLAAMLLFQHAAVEYWLLEVGLGGRLDAVNMLSADLAIITSIDIDHESWLGSSREQIAFEKAGILREGIPFICADPSPPSSLIEQAASLGVGSYYIGENFKLDSSENGVELLVTSPEGKAQLISINNAQVPLYSLAAACQAFLLLAVNTFDQSHKDALSNLVVEGRYSEKRLESGQTIIFDVAHNPAAAKQLATKLANENRAGGIAAVAAFMADKDLKGVCGHLVGDIDEWHLAALPEIPRAAKPASVVSVLRECGVPEARVQCYSNVELAMKSVLNQSKVKIILVFGSFYTVADALNVCEQLD